MSNEKALLCRIKDYIKEGVEQSVKLFDGEMLCGKIAAYNDIYDWIENILEQEAE